MPGGPVLFAYDGSPQAREAIRQARWLLRNGRDAIVLTVWGLLSTVPFAGAPGVPPVGLAEGLERKARRLADEGARLARANGFEAEAVAEEGGSAWHSIVDAADKYDASVVVMGSHGRTGIRLMLLGSVAAAVARHTERPVLIAHDGASAEEDSAPSG